MGGGGGGEGEVREGGGRAGCWRKYDGNTIQTEETLNMRHFIVKN